MHWLLVGQTGHLRFFSLTHFRQSAAGSSSSSIPQLGVSAGLALLLVLHVYRYYYYYRYTTVQYHTATLLYTTGTLPYYNIHVFLAQVAGRDQRLLA